MFKWQFVVPKNLDCSFPLLRRTFHWINFYLKSKECDVSQRILPDKSTVTTLLAAHSFSQDCADLSLSACRFTMHRSQIPFEESLRLAYRITSHSLTVAALTILQLLLSHGSVARAQVTDKVTVTARPDPCPRGATLDAGVSCISSKEYLDSQWNRGSGQTERGYFTFHKPPGDSNSPGTSCNLSPKTKMPVILATGEKTLNEIDFEDLSLFGLSLSRTYRSNGDSHMFGKGWASSFAYTQLESSPECRFMTGYSWLGCLPIWLRLTTLDGVTLTFYRDAQVPMYWLNGQPNSGPPINAFSSGTWMYSYQGRTYRFSSTTRTMTSIDDQNSREFTFTYGAYGQLATVQSRSGKIIQFNWSVGLNRVASVIDPSGKIWKYEYNDTGILNKVIPPDDPKYVRSYSYNPNSWQLTGRFVNGEQQTRVAYDTQKRAIWSGYENAEEFDTFEYGPDLTIRRDHNGQSTTYTFEAAGSGSLRRLTRVDRHNTDTCTATNALQTYDSNGFLQSETDFRGSRTDYINSPDGRLIRRVVAPNSPSQMVTDYVWQDSRLMSATDSGSNGVPYLLTEFTYGTGLAYLWPIAKIQTDLATGATRMSNFGYAFHANGVLMERWASKILQDGTNATTSESFDAQGNRTLQRNTLGHVIRWSEYDALGRAGTMLDANGIRHAYLYDTIGNVTEVNTSSPFGSRSTRYIYDGAGRIALVFLPSGAMQRYEYNTAGRMVALRDNSGGLATFGLDVAQRSRTTTVSRNVAAVSGSALVASPQGNFSSNTQQDSLGRLYAAVGNTGQHTNYRYDDNGNVVSVTDAANRQTRYFYDEQNRLQHVGAPDGGGTAMRYDDKGNLQTVTDSRGLSTTYWYNGFGEVTRRQSSDTGETTFSYDNIGRLIQEARSNGVNINYVWDPLDRLLMRSSGGSTETFAYDDGLHGIGKITRVQDASGITTYGYASDGQLSQQVSSVQGSTYATSYIYNLHGQRVGMTYPNGLALSYEYDSLGRLSSVTSNLGAWPTLANDFLYQPTTNKPYAWRFGNNVSHVHTHDSDGRLITNWTSAGGLNLSYGWSTTNSLVQITDNVWPLQSSVFNYDANDRLASVAKTGGNESFTLDSRPCKTPRARMNARDSG